MTGQDSRGPGEPAEASPNPGPGEPAEASPNPGPGEPAEDSRGAPERSLTLSRALLRSGIVVSIAAAAFLAGAFNGVGPLARTTAAAEVTDPAEMLVRSMQAVIDASSVHVEAAVTGQVPGALVGRSDASVALDGTVASIDLRPQDARTHVVFGSPSLGIVVEAITSWDTMAYRFDAGSWSKGSLASVVAGAGIDANPLTLVDRMRKWLAAPGAPVPAATTEPCDAPSGVCRRVVVTLGREAGDVLLAAFPDKGSLDIGATTSDVTLLTDAATLRPAHLTFATRNADGSLAVTLAADFTLWNWPSVISDPPGG